MMPRTFVTTGAALLLALGLSASTPDSSVPLLYPTSVGNSGRAARPM